MTINTAYQQLLHQLYELYDDREAANIADWVIEFITGQRRIDRIIYKHIPLNKAQQLQLQLFTDRLLSHQPVQYVLNETWFAGMKFYVDKNVLIPRPETEELVEEVVTMYDVRSTMYDTNSKRNQENNSHKKSEIRHQKLKILDIGTGSGCIPIALKKKLPNTNITSLDISKNALDIAKKNAIDLQADITFKQMDFLDETRWDTLEIFDIIISNPPYIKESESRNMSKHVTSYEPSIALFIADDDALIFYKKIALFGRTHLKKNGQIFVEINEVLGNETTALFNSFGYQTLLKKDLQSRDRMVQAWIY